MRTVQKISVFSLVLLWSIIGLGHTTRVRAALPTEVDGQTLPSLAEMVEKVQA